MKTLLALIAGALIATLPALAAHTFPLRFITGPFLHLSPNGCVQAPDDMVDRVAGINSVLESGATVTDSWCVVEDSTAHVVATRFASDSASLVVTVTVDGVTQPVAPVFDKRLGLWSYTSCTPVATPGVETMTNPSVSLTNTDRRGAKVRYDWFIVGGSC